MHTEDYIRHVNKTSRSAGAVGKEPLCYRELASRLANDPTPVGIRVLDYGCGKAGAARATDFLMRFPKLRLYLPYDIGANNQHKFQKDRLEQAMAVHRLEQAMAVPFDYVVLSNVLNVQRTEHELLTVLAEAWAKVWHRGILICNYPTKPRHSTVPEDRLKQYLAELDQHYYCPKPHVYILKKA